MSAPKEAVREALRLFPRLAGEVRLVADRSAWPAPARHYVVRSQKSSRGGAIRIPATIVEHWRARDWLEAVEGERDGAFRLGAAGAAWLRRQTSGADPFQEQHQHRNVVERQTPAGRRPLLVNETESPLGWLRSRKDASGRPLIDDAQYQSGERLREDFWRAGLTPRLTSNPAAPPPGKRTRRGAGSGAAALTEAALAARQRVENALDAVGPELSGILLSVCCLSQGLEAAERDHGWPQRAGKAILQLALTRLARHYGLMPAAASWRRRKGIAAWGAPGYRPTMDRWK